MAFVSLRPHSATARILPSAWARERVSAWARGRSAFGPRASGSAAGSTLFRSASTHSCTASTAPVKSARSGRWKICQNEGFVRR
jgi:hypothetical protein